VCHDCQEPKRAAHVLLKRFEEAVDARPECKARLLRLRDCEALDGRGDVVLVVRQLHTSHHERILRIHLHEYWKFFALKHGVELFLHRQRRAAVCGYK